MTVKPEIDPTRAKQLRALGMTWRAVGRRLAEEEGRSVCFQETSVMRAVAKSDGKAWAK